jgi:hypothetical protein
VTEPELTRDHIIRADLPWRKAALTECGRKISSVEGWTTMADIADRVRRLGKQRTAFTVCMTCYSTGWNYQTWEQDPIDVIRRHATRYGRDNDNELLRAELRAIAALIEAHRDEFDGYIEGLAETIDLASRRRRAR